MVLVFDDRGDGATNTSKMMLRKVRKVNPLAEGSDMIRCAAKDDG